MSKRIDDEKAHNRRPATVTATVRASICPKHAKARFQTACPNAHLRRSAFPSAPCNADLGRPSTVRHTVDGYLAKHHVVLCDSAGFVGKHVRDLPQFVVQVHRLHAQTVRRVHRRRAVSLHHVRQLTVNRRTRMRGEGERKYRDQQHSCMRWDRGLVIGENNWYLPTHTLLTSTHPHTHTHTHTYTYTHIHTHTHTHTYIHTDTQTHRHTHSRPHTHLSASMNTF